MKRIRGVVAYLMAAVASWATCNTGAFTAQQQMLVMLSLAIGYLYKLTVQTSKYPSEPLEIEFDLRSYVD